MEKIRSDIRLPWNRTVLYVMWLFENKPIGHSNINNIVYGQEAYMHLHLWAPRNATRHRYVAPAPVAAVLLQELQAQRTLLRTLFTQYRSEQDLERMGFELVKKYETTPGWINFHQP